MVAYLTFDKSSLKMDVDMFFLVRTLIESDLTTLHRALIGSLTSVNSQVIEQIMPSLEYLIAVLVIAYECLSSSLRVLGAAEADKCEISRARNR